MLDVRRLELLATNTNCHLAVALPSRAAAGAHADPQRVVRTLCHRVVHTSDATHVAVSGRGADLVGRRRRLWRREGRRPGRWRRRGHRWRRPWIMADYLWLVTRRWVDVERHHRLKASSARNSRERLEDKDGDDGAALATHLLHLGVLHVGHVHINVLVLPGHRDLPVVFPPRKADLHLGALVPQVGQLVARTKLAVNGARRRGRRAHDAAAQSRCSERIARG